LTTNGTTGRSFLVLSISMGRIQEGI
jgi:hypothetical protein